MHFRNITLAAALTFSSLAGRASAAGDSLTVWLRLPIAGDARDAEKVRQAKDSIATLVPADAEKSYETDGSRMRLRLTAPGWSARLSVARREAILKTLSADWADDFGYSFVNRLNGGASKLPARAMTAKAAQGGLNVVPQSLRKGQFGSAYDGGSQAEGGAEVPAIAAQRSAAGARAALPAPAPANTAARKSDNLVPPAVDETALDTTAKACVDFYQYACGGWVAKNPVPSDKSRWSRFGKLYDDNTKLLEGILENAEKRPGNAEEKKVGDFYAACKNESAMDARGLSPIRPELDRIEAMTSKSALSEELGHLRNIGVGAIFGFGASADYQDAKMAMGSLYQGGLSLPDRDYYIKPEYSETRRDYVQHLRKMFAAAGESDADALRHAREVLRIEGLLARASMANVDQRNPEKINNKSTITELQKQTPSFDWSQFLKTAGAPKIDKLINTSPQFFAALESTIQTVTLDQWKTYLRAKLIGENSSVLSKTFRDEAFDFYSRKLNGQKEQEPRWKQCAEQTDGMLGEALGKIYVDKYFSPESKQSMLKMIGQIEDAMGGDIRQLSWMGDETKEKGLDKLHKVVNKIGYPDHFRDYSKVSIDRKDFFRDVRNAEQFEIRRYTAKIGRPVDRGEWGMTPPTVNASYSPKQNNINFPAGILQYPFFSQKRDMAANYGGIGSVIGHELTHGFDDQGRKYDGDGNFHNWWTDADGKAFEQRAQGLIKQYGSYVAVRDPRDPQKNVMVNGQLTLGENTADNGGIRLAYTALMSNPEMRSGAKIGGFTPAQRFFLGFGQVWCGNITDQNERVLAATDPHSPAKYRTNGTVSNMPEFQQAFSCKDGDPMAPKDRNRVW